MQDQIKLLLPLFSLAERFKRSTTYPNLTLNFEPLNETLQSNSSSAREPATREVVKYFLAIKLFCIDVGTELHAPSVISLFIPPTVVTL